MISELAGFSVSRVIPDKCLAGLMTGAYKMCGGVIRDNSGKIVAHLISGFNPLTALAPVNDAIGGLNTFQLYKLGKDMSTLLKLAKGTMALSGLTLAVSAAGFIYLNNKLNKIDAQLKSLAGGVKYITKFLEYTERAKLIDALETLSRIEQSSDQETRRIKLVNTMKTIGQIHVKYRIELSNVTHLEEVLPIEEYFSITALGHAMCAAELNELNQAVSILDSAYTVWLKESRRIVKNNILQANPERFLFPTYAPNIKTEELIEWMDFVHGEEKGINRIDELRLNFANLSNLAANQIFQQLIQWIPNLPLPWPLSLIPKPIANNTVLELELLRKLCARNSIYTGYISQYQFMQEIGKRPSELQAYFDSLKVGDNECYLLVDNDLLEKRTRQKVKQLA